MTVFDALPKGAHSVHPFGARAARDDRGIDGADRRADDPVEVDGELIEGLIDADLIGAERPAALEHQHLLTVGGRVRIYNTLRHERCPELEEGCRLFDRAEGAASGAG